MKTILISFFLLFIFTINVNLYADPYGTLVGAYNGVNCYSNGFSGNVSNEYNYVNGTNTGMKWQCVEFVNRYYLMYYNQNIRVAGHNAIDYYPNASAHGLNPYPNNGTNSPQVGDVLCFSGNTYGHVALIREIGSNYLKVIQQNVTNSASDINYNVTMTYNNGQYNVSGASIGSGYSCQGWLRRSGTVNCNFTVNNNSLTNWIFWKYPPMPVNFYNVNLTISNLTGNWALFISRNNSNLGQIAANQSGTNYNFQFAVSTSDPTYPNGGGYYFRLTPQGQFTTSWCESIQFSISALPSMSIVLNPSQSTYMPGQPVTVTWPITGGLGGNYGGLTGNIRLQYYKNDTALGNIVTTALINNSFNWIVPTSIPGGTIPGCGYKIAGSIQDGNAPNGYVYAFSIPFCITSPLSIEQIEGIVPKEFLLYQNSPNPFNPVTSIYFDLAEKKFAVLRIYDATGKVSVELVNQELNSGSYKVDWNASIYPSGIYFYRLEAGDFSDTKKMILVK